MRTDYRQGFRKFIYERLTVTGGGYRVLRVGYFWDGRAATLEKQIDDLV
jgi:cytochrome c peroxidase